MQSNPGIKSARFDCPVIIDNMMNLEMLNWVSQNGGDKKISGDSSYTLQYNNEESLSTGLQFLSCTGL